MAHPEGRRGWPPVLRSLNRERPVVVTDGTRYRRGPVEVVASTLCGVQRHPHDATFVITVPGTGLGRDTAHDDADRVSG
jgi:hypothetical protein